MVNGGSQESERVIVQLPTGRFLSGAVTLALTSSLPACTPYVHHGIEHMTVTSRRAEGPNQKPPFEPPPYPFDVAAEAGLPDACMTHVIAAMILSRKGSPTIPVTINGERGAAFISPSQDMVGVFDGNDERLDLPTTGRMGSVTLANMQVTYLTQLEDMELAQGHATKVPAIKMGELNEPPSIAMSGLAILGYDLLGNYDVLIDVPARRLLLFRPPDIPECHDLSKAAGGGYQTPLIMGRTGARNVVTVQLDGAPVAMYPEPASNLSVMSEKDALADGLTRSQLDVGDRTNTLDGQTLIGYRHKYRAVSIGNWHSRQFGVNIERTNYNILGETFFRHRKVLLAFPTSMMFFSGEIADSGPKDTTRGNPSPISSHVAHTSVMR